ncbi:hypothetical protein J4475_04110 [Candidatus Woesearchaeota archaeon]|nr:hypothetical protein [Candidatus Woesearchaeota archaeon]
MLFSHRKAQQKEAAGAAAFVLVLIGFVVLYILILPPQDREELLFGDIEGVPAQPKVQEAAPVILLKESPGRVSTFKEDGFDHQIPSFNLFSTVEDQVIKQNAGFVVETTKSKETSKSMVIVFSNPTHVSNAKVSFNVRDHSGRLIITLNGNEVLRGEVTESQPVPISLENLQGENIVEFTAEDPGWQFWKTNFYELAEVKVTASITDISNRKAVNTFFVEDEESRNIESASLLYVADCIGEGEDRVMVRLNGREISNSVPSCGSPNKIGLAPTDLRAGRNELEFESTGGNYEISHVTVQTKLRKQQLPVYFFTISDAQARNISSNNVNATLFLEFTDGTESKVADVSINGYLIRVDTKGMVYYKRINQFLESGNNFVKIDPKTSLDIVEVRVQYLPVNS